MPGDAAARTERWLERVVIGLGLCPFAAPVVDAGGLEVFVSDARDTDTLTADLDAALARLDSLPAARLETVLLVAEHVLGDFDAFNAYLDVADALVAARGLDGRVQIASFHPDYVFADAGDDDPANFTNRAPYPTLHLLREASVARAVDGHPDTSRIPERNAALLRGMSAAALTRLFGGN